MFRLNPERISCTDCFNISCYPEKTVDMTVKDSTCYNNTAYKYEENKKGVNVGIYCSCTVILISPVST